MAKLLVDAEYWNRLWVVQEIGKAAELQVCYQSVKPKHTESDIMSGLIYGADDLFVYTSRDHAIRWNAFISSVKQKTQIESGPLRLDKQLRGKYQGSHSLRSLLRTHHGALCRDPHDKIYGLAGFADDCYGFSG